VELPLSVANDPGPNGDADSHDELSVGGCDSLLKDRTEGLPTGAII